MGADEGNAGEYRIRAELFEVLSHETRIEILRTIERQPTTFAELKKTLRMESSGNLQHHLGKLGDLVKQTNDGRYSLGDDGREALKMLNAIRAQARPPSNASEKVHDLGESGSLLRPSPWRVVKLAILTLVAVFFLLAYLADPTTENLLFLGSISSCVVAIVLGTLVTSIETWRRVVTSLAFLFMSLSVFLYVSSMHFLTVDRAVNVVLFTMFLWVPIYMLFSRELLRAYEREPRPHPK